MRTGVIKIRHVIAACPPSAIADDLQLYHTALSPSSNQHFFLPTHLIPASVCQLLYYTTVLFKVLYCKIKNIYFLFVFFMHYLFEKYYNPITVWYYAASCVSWVPRLTLLASGTNLTYKHALRMELVCM